MYHEIGQIDAKTQKELLDLANKAQWKMVNGSGRNYNTAYIDAEQVLDWKNLHGAFFLKIPPGGKVHKHIDVDHPWSTYHIVVQSNDKALNYSEGEAFNLEAGKIYSVDRSVEHWSVNDGDTDRIHLLVEAYE